MNRKEMLELSVYRQGLLTGILNIAFYNRPSEGITVNTGNLVPLIEIQPTQRNVLHTILPLYELDIPFETKNEPSSIEINILGM